MNFEESYSFGAGFQGTDLLANTLFVTTYFVGTRTSGTGPAVFEVANAEGESPVIAPNTWVEIKGVNLAPSGDARIWQGSDFVGNLMPTQLDKVSVTVNGKSAFVYYISPTQINVLTPPDSMSGVFGGELTLPPHTPTAACWARPHYIPALPHIAGRSAMIHAHTGRQVHHARSRSTLSTVRKVAESAPFAIRTRSPEPRISSTGAWSFLSDALASIKANRTGWIVASRFRQL